MRGDSQQQVLRFDAFTLDLARCSLRRGDTSLPIRPKAFDMLCYLANHPGRLVSKEELHANEAGWVNAQVDATEWQVLHWPALCPAGATWHELHAEEAPGCVKTQVTAISWQLVQNTYKPDSRGSEHREVAWWSRICCDCSRDNDRGADTPFTL